MRGLGVVFVLAALCRPAHADRCLVADNACFPACRAGFSCDSGTCVADKPIADKPVEACFPACREGYACNSGRCEAIASVTPVTPVSVDAPPTPPHYEVFAGNSLPSLFLGNRAPRNEMHPDGTVLYGGRTLAISGGMMLRERDNLWVSLEAGYGSIDHTKYFSGTQHSGDAGVVLLAASGVLRVPIGGPGWGLLVDRQVALDLSVGPYALLTSGDFGGMFAAQLSVLWFKGGPLLSVGSDSGLSVGIISSAHVAF